MIHHTGYYKFSPKVCWATYWDAGYLMTTRLKLANGYVERPFEKRTTQWQFTPEHHKYRPKVSWATFWEAGYLRTDTTGKINGYIERPLEKRAARTPFTPNNHIYSLKTTEYRVYDPVTIIAIYFIEIYILYTSTTLLREFEFGEIRVTVVTVGGIVHWGL